LQTGRIGRLAAVVAVAAYASGASQAQPGPNTIEIYKPPAAATIEPTGRIAALIATLADPSWQKRDAAEHALIAMGPTIEPQVRWALAREDAAVPEADLLGKPTGGSPRRVVYGLGSVLPRDADHELAVVLNHLEEQRAGTTSRFTLHYANAPLPEILRDFGAQTGMPLAVQAYAAPVDWVASARASIDVDGVTYWDALRVMHRTLGLSRFDFGRRSGNLVASYRATTSRAPVPDPEPFALDAPSETVSGPFLIAPLSVESRHSVNLATGAETTTMVLMIVATAEPRIRLGQSAIVTVDVCTDDEGRSLLIGDQRVFVGGPSDARDWYWQIPITLAAPAAGRRIGALRAHLGVGIGPPGQYIVLANVKANGQLHFDGNVVTARWNTRSVITASEINLEISVPAGSPMSRVRSVDVYGPTPLGYFSVLDQDRQSIGQMSFFWDSSRQGNRDVVRGYIQMYDPTQMPTTLRWLTPNETRWMTVPFELHDIGVPPVVIR